MTPSWKPRDLTVRFGRRPALRDVGVDFAGGEAAVIAGSNGAGKSTLLRCLAGVIVPDRGRIIAGPGLTKAKIGFISDRLSLYEDWTLRRGLAASTGAPSGFRGPTTGPDRRLGARSAAAGSRRLSVGERTLFHLSLLLAQRPVVLLVDEVVHALDPFLREKFLETVIGAMDELSTAVIMVNHTLSDTAQIPERVLIMDDGRFILDERREETLERSVKKVSGETAFPPEIPCLFEASSEFRGPLSSSPSGRNGGTAGPSSSRTSAWTRSSRLSSEAHMFKKELTDVLRQTLWFLAAMLAIPAALLALKVIPRQPYPTLFISVLQPGLFFWALFLGASIFGRERGQKALEYALSLPYSRRGWLVRLAGARFLIWIVLWLARPRPRSFGRSRSCAATCWAPTWSSRSGD